MKISLVLPMVKDLDGFMSNLTSVTSALRSPSTAPAGALLECRADAGSDPGLPPVRRLLARIDRWMVEQVLPWVGARSASPAGRRASARTSIGSAPSSRAVWPPPQAPRAPRPTRSPNARTAPLARFAASWTACRPPFQPSRRGPKPSAGSASNLEVLETAADSTPARGASLSRIEPALTAVGVPIRSSRRSSAGSTGHAGDREPGRLLGVGLREVEPHDSGTARPDLDSLKDALDLINVSMEQGNSLYRSIVKKMFDEKSGGSAVRGTAA